MRVADPWVSLPCLLGELQAKGETLPGRQNGLDGPWRMTPDSVLFSIWICTCEPTQMCTYIYMHTWMCTFKLMWVCTCKLTRIHTCEPTWICAYKLHAYECMSQHEYMQTTYIHTCEPMWICAHKLNRCTGNYMKGIPLGKVWTSRNFPS